jgi:hypothetical protein
MRVIQRVSLIFSVAVLLSLPAQAQSQRQAQAPKSSSASQQSMAGMDMSGHGNAGAHDMSAMHDMSGINDTPSAEGDAADHAMHSMEGHHMDMGPHMKMTALRESRPGDEERAAQIVETARKAAEKYTDYHVALADGYKIFHPNVPQKQYHFTNNWYAFEATYRFNPEHPTSLLYEKHGDDYKLIGVMYTAPRRMTEDDLDKRIPLSVAQWHEHVNLCLPPAEQRGQMLGPHPKFGFAGSISTQQECDAAGGKFMPIIFNWMVHVYPFEQKPEDVWAVDRNHDHHPGD